MARRWGHARWMGVGGRTSVYGEAQGPGNGSIYSNPATSFSPLGPQLFVLDLSPPERPSRGAGRPFSVECCPLRLAALAQPSQMTSVQDGESELLSPQNLSPKYHCLATKGNHQPVFSAADERGAAP